MNKEEFERQARCVATAWGLLENTDPDAWGRIFKRYDLGFVYAWMIYAHHGTLNKEGKKQVTDTYDFLLRNMEGLPAGEYYDYLDMITAWGEMQ